MSTANYLLSRHHNPKQFTLTRATRDKFIASDIFQGQTDSDGFDHLTLTPNKNLRTDFPDCIFDKIPNKVNSTAFLKYLGVNNATAERILSDTCLRTHGMVDGEALLHQLRLFASGLGNILDDKFFTKDLIADVNRLKHKSSQTPAIMNQYLAQSTSKTIFAELTNYDYLSKIFSDRVANLNSLDRAVDYYVKN